MSPGEPSAQTEEAVVTAARAGDAHAFTALSERYRPLLLVHCYRMLGSVDDAEDLVQETLLRAWRGRAAFEGRSQFRTWLYRIATNACLNVLERAPRRVLPQDVAPPVTTGTPASEARAQPAFAPEVPWLQPYPDSLLNLAAPSDTEPEATAISRETIELAYLAALQHLPPRQRAILILRDVLDWSAKETASLLEASVPSVNSAHQRARATMRSKHPTGFSDRLATETPTEQQLAVLHAFMEAWERADADKLTALLREDARWAMPPAPLWFDGRAAIIRLYALYPIGAQGEFRQLASAANRQPATASFLRRPGDHAHRLVALHVLRVEGGKIAEVTTFGPELCHAFGFPQTLPAMSFSPPGV